MKQGWGHRHTGAHQLSGIFHWRDRAAHETTTELPGGHASGPGLGENENDQLFVVVGGSAKGTRRVCLAAACDAAVVPVARLLCTSFCTRRAQSRRRCGVSRVDVAGVSPVQSWQGVVPLRMWAG
jgi:hypothetical protein